LIVGGITVAIVIAGVTGLPLEPFPAAGPNWPILIGFAGGGILGFLLAVPLYILFVFLTGAGLGGLMVMFVYNNIMGAQYNAVVLVVVALILGLTAIRFQEFVIMLATAFCGAYGIVYGTGVLLNPNNPNAGLSLTNLSGMTVQSLPYVLALFIVGLAGLFIQYRGEHQG